MIKVQPPIDADSFEKLIRQSPAEFNVLEMARALTYLERSEPAKTGDIALLRGTWEDWKAYQEEVHTRAMPTAGSYARLTWVPSEDRLLRLEALAPLQEILFRHREKLF